MSNQSKTREEFFADTMVKMQNFFQNAHWQNTTSYSELIQSCNEMLKEMDDAIKDLDHSIMKYLALKKMAVMNRNLIEDVIRQMRSKNESEQSGVDSNLPPEVTEKIDAGSVESIKNPQMDMNE